jgi:hypothetical protein
MLGKETMKIGRLILLGALVLGVSASAGAATTVPKLHAPGATTLTADDSGKDKKASKAHKQKAKKPKKEKKP